MGAPGTYKGAVTLEQAMLFARVSGAYVDREHVR